jgi:hypothetical protein
MMAVRNAVHSSFARGSSDIEWPFPSRDVRAEFVPWPDVDATWLDDRSVSAQAVSARQATGV